MSKFRLFGGGKARNAFERCPGWVRAIDLAEDDTHRLSDSDLAQSLSGLRQRHQNGESLDDLLAETFAIVREAAVRTLGERPFHEQLIGGAALHLGSVVEMRTGEGKTLTAVLPACLHALAGKGVHVLTANDYLAARDAEWMGPVYRFLGLRSALLAEDDRSDKRDTVYNADVVYGTPSGFAYDYLRDNLTYTKEEVVQHGHFSAIVDEADLVMLDEVSILPQITAPADGPSDHARLAGLATRLKRDVHYEVDEVRRTVSPTEQGMALVEDWLGAAVYSGDDVGLARRVSLALQVKELYVKDRDYAVVDGAIRIIDAATQRLLTDRRLGTGLDQALDAKEGLTVRRERQALAEIGQHGYLRLYPHLAGMAGVVKGEGEAYRDFYGLEALIVAPRRPVRRVDHDPVVYPDDAAMLRAMRKTVDEKRAAGRPVLVGTASDEIASKISLTLQAGGIEHDVLDARNHGFEAEIVARAGRPGAVTVLTRMAGRGVDIRLAEPEGPGLFVLGLGPLTSRRLELHLRGRAGRWGDPGESAFFLSFEDPHLSLPRPFERLGDAAGADEPAVNRLITRSIEATLNRLSARTTEKSAHALRYAAVQEEQRAAVYTRRKDILTNGFTREQVNSLVEKVMRSFVIDARTGTEDVEGLSTTIRNHYPATVGLDVIAAGLSGDPTSKARADLIEAVVRDALSASAARESDLGPDVAAELRRRVMLAVMNQQWAVQLRDLDDTRDSLFLRTAAGGDPLTEYRRAASRLAARMWKEIDEQFVGYWFSVQVTIT
ncbi:hypothetical protein KGQ20_00355 [Catenulispora sp. NF23]|uniref:preprotein translocase subunit SecA n=1 Tax=Catenulispora pinistramenti TaxID=2705254 RepID=UPI001BABD948|nr:DEAD/DEAH box helicase [Catenulispora pinistramenti]MBS2531216.1 hypothetical protein [Catenulispora pinistramenti]